MEREMMKDKKYIVRQTYTHEIVALVADEKELMAFIGKEANEHNYGMYRHWVREGDAYYDCGPRTYYVNANILNY
ncbi:MAG: hypothetical protein LIR50_11935 [Bacillota bacterium]|nr:hypothetical protein [Bacillota bacterium]